MAWRSFGLCETVHRYMRNVYGYWYCFLNYLYLGVRVKQSALYISRIFIGFIYLQVVEVATCAFAQSEANLSAA